MRRISIIAWVTMTVLLTACGGDASSIYNESGTSTTTSTGTGTTTTSTAASLTAITSATSILADGSTTATITVLARNSSNDLVSGVDVSFAADSGGVAVTQGTTDSSGAATATLSTAGDSSVRTITVTATSGSLTATVKVQVEATSSATTSVVSSLTLSSSTTSILDDGSTTATISALAKDASNNALSGVAVSFAATNGAIAVTQATTNSDGLALATLSGTGDTALTPITVTGSTGSLSSTVKVLVTVATASPTYSMGNGSGSSFTSGAISIAVPSLSAGGTSGFTLTIVDQTGALYTGSSVTVTFNSPCLADSLASILASGSTAAVTSLTTSTGSISGTYVAKGCTGTDTITATATVGSQNISATGTVTVAASSIGSIQFESASPSTIGLKGTGLGETSNVIFKVTDSTGAAKAGATVSFTLDTTVGGLSLSPTSAISASDGTVQTVVSSGTVHTAVRVTASIASPALSTESSQLTVTTGLPASASFSIAVSAPSSGEGSVTLACPNVEAWGIDGVTVPVVVRLADRYNNPVPDGTAVAFTTNGGHITGSCTTPNLLNNNTEPGACAVNWISANPRPATLALYASDTANDPYYTTDTPTILASGRATILATAVGEESFTDVNGTGFWQSGDAFSNLGEPYRDDNENGTYDSGEYFLDFNENSRRDGPSGSFIGITCTGTTASSTCTTSTLAISASHLIIMSTSGATVSYVSSTGFSGSGSGLSIAPNSSGSVIINVQDGNGNSMAAGTTVAFTSTVGSASGNFTVGCDDGLGGQNYVGSFSVPSGAAAGTGNIVVTVTSPNGTVSQYYLPVTIT
jgi:Big-like domain-containing protein